MALTFRDLNKKEKKKVFAICYTIYLLELFSLLGEVGKQKLYTSSSTSTITNTDLVIPLNLGKKLL